MTERTQWPLQCNAAYWKSEPSESISNADRWIQVSGVQISARDSVRIEKAAGHFAADIGLRDRAGTAARTIGLTENRKVHHTQCGRVIFHSRIEPAILGIPSARRRARLADQGNASAA